MLPLALAQLNEDDADEEKEQRAALHSAEPTPEHEVREHRGSQDLQLVQDLEHRRLQIRERDVQQIVLRSVDDRRHCELHPISREQRVDDCASHVRYIPSALVAYDREARNELCQLVAEHRDGRQVEV